MGYATLTDLANCGLPNGALASLSNTVKQAALDDRSAYADTFIGCKYTLPLIGTPDRTLVRYVCFQAAWDLLALRGYNPDNPGDVVVRMRYEDADKWYQRVADGHAGLVVIQSAPESAQPDTGTNPMRNIGDFTGMGNTDDPIVGGSSGGWGG